MRLEPMEIAFAAHCVSLRPGTTAKLLPGWLEDPEFRFEAVAALLDEAGKLAKTSGTERAAAAYRKALQIDPQMYEANMALAWVFEKQDRPQDAIALYQKATQIRPSEVEPLRGLARCYRAAGMTVQADQTLAEIQKRVQATGNR